ncbi:unnamed protein product [Effrenium voratum]|nr:unnamed protein product [Effrenium voratum]
MARKQWSRRAEKKDPSFDMGSEVQKLDKESSRKLSRRGWAQCCAWQLWKSLAARLQGPKRASCRDSWPPHAKEGRRSHQKLGQRAEEVLAKALCSYCRPQCESASGHSGQAAVKKAAAQGGVGPEAASSQVRSRQAETGAWS